MEDTNDHQQEREELEEQGDVDGEEEQEEEEVEGGGPAADPEQDKIKPVIYISLVLTSLFSLGES